MTINEALDYIHAVDWRRSSLGLSRIDELLAQMGHPERTMKFVHVTGTNGKGSTCAILASVLRAAGYRTGLYTSPYIFRFNERMQIDGAPISDAELCAVTEEVRPLADGMADHPTEFEMVTAIAFSWFASRKCDIVVCEVGMGGELDATNVIPAPEAAVLCNIGLDHTAYLGDTVEKIAATKSGIIKAGCDAVLYPCAPSVREVVADRCRRCGVTLHSVDMDALVLSATRWRDRSSASARCPACTCPCWDGCSCATPLRPSLRWRYCAAGAGPSVRTPCGRVWRRCAGPSALRWYAASRWW